MAVQSLVEDLRELCLIARQEESQGTRVTADCTLVVSGSSYFAHASILLARSKFLRKAFSQNMQEARDKVVELKHVHSDIPKEAVHALLLFMYTNCISEISSAGIGWSVVELLGAEEADFLALSGTHDLRRACADVIIDSMQAHNIPEALKRAHSLGPAAVELKQLLMENLIASLSNVDTHACFKCFQGTPDLLNELLAMVASCMIRKPGWQPRKRPRMARFTLTSNGFHPRLANTAEALMDGRMDTGAGTLSSLNPAYLAFEFDAAVTVTALSLGIGSMGQHWCHYYLDRAWIKYSVDKENWQDAAVVHVGEDNLVRRIPFSTPITARYWRLTKMDYLGLSCIEFE
jgi:hypothetical protein